MNEPGAGWRGLTTSRRAGPDDAPAVADILIRSRRATEAIPPAVHSDREVRAWVRDVVLPKREVWLAESNTGRPLAILVLDGGWIDQLYVEPAVTGQKLGSQLIELAKSRRPDGLQLWTFAANVNAQRFYRRHGFAEAERTDGSGNEEKAPDVRFVWSPA